MKVLYIANERRAAQLAGHALRGIALNVTLTWARTLSSALQWVQSNRDTAVIVVEAEVQGQGCASFVEHVRGLGLTTPLVVVAPEHLGAPTAALNSGADDYVVEGRALQADLPRILTGTLQRARAAAPATRQSDRVLRATIDRARTNWEVLEAKLAEAEHRVSDGRGAIAREEATRRMELEQRLAQEAARRETLEQNLATAESARHDAEQRCESELAAAAARLADSRAHHDASLARATNVCTALQQRLLELEAALRHAEERRATEAAASADQVTQRHAEVTSSLAQAAQRRDALAEKLRVAMAALDEARQTRRAEAAAAAEHLARREAELEAALVEAAAARTAVEGTLAGAAAAHQHAQERAAADLAAAAERQAALEDRLIQEAANCSTLEQHLATIQAARQDADHRHATELATAAMRLADLQAQYEAARTENTAVRAALEQQLTDAAAALERAGEERAREAATAAEHLARREAELEAALAGAVAARTAVEGTLAGAAAAHQHAQERAAADLAAAAEREGTLVERLHQESAMRTALERDLAESRTKSAHARRRLLEVASALRRRAREHKARLEAQLNRERADSERALAARTQEIRQIQLERETLQQVLATAQEELEHLHSTVNEERQGYERARLTSESELQRLSAEYHQVRQSLDQVRAAFGTLEHVAGEHAVERARLESVVADRDAQLRTQAAGHLAAERAAAETLAQVQERFRLAFEASRRDIAQLQRDMDVLRQELDATRARAAALRSDAERVPVLQLQLEEFQQENRRQFERAPYALCECTRDGAIIRVNDSLVTLLGYGKADDVRRVDFAATVFECAGDLRWLIERSASTGTTESVETTWKTRDRRRLFVRLHALTTTDGSVAIAVEDLTALRAVEQRLHQAQRMEAVGRVASEVAVTCDTLLRDVAQGGQQWLAAIGSDTPLRHQGELLLGEVTRAAGFLRQFAVYGSKQISALAPVSVQRVLRDLGPVLKRVAGGNITLVLPKTSDLFDVDVEAEPVERIFVNVANYARERMPHGGRVKIDLATTVVDRTFLANHPNVRPGAHVLITVTEERGAIRPALPIELRAAPTAGASRSASDKPGVDLGALLTLIGDLGGHLWMAAEPSGNMTLKIHLPKRVSDDVTDPAPPAARSDRGRQLARWFRH